MGELRTDRLVALREERGLSQAALAREIGIGQSTMVRLEKGGTRNPRDVTKLARALDCSTEYLLGETDERHSMTLGVDPHAARPQSRSTASELTDVLSIDLNFGLGPVFMDQEVVEHQAEVMQFPTTWLRQITSSPASSLYWTRGIGNSMEPTISDGDVILIDRSKVGSSFGDLYWAISYGQTGMIKRLRPMPDGGVKILSDNPAVPPETAYDGELNVFGRVVAIVKRV